MPIERVHLLVGQLVHLWGDRLHTANFAAIIPPAVLEFHRATSRQSRIFPIHPEV